MLKVGGQERGFVYEGKRRAEVWSRSGEEYSTVFCVKDVYVLEEHLRSVVLAYLQPSSPSHLDVRSSFVLPISQKFGLEAFSQHLHIGSYFLGAE